MEKYNSLSIVENSRDSVANKLQSTMSKIENCIERLEAIDDKLSSKDQVGKEQETIAQLIDEFYMLTGDFLSIAFIRDHDEIMNEQGKLWELIWYERHKCLAYEIEQGTDSCDPAIWSTAKLRAKEIERKYGDDILVKSDFEWGMRNGRLSTLNWILGQE